MNSSLDIAYYKPRNLIKVNFQEKFRDRFKFLQNFKKAVLQSADALFHILQVMEN